MKSLYCSPVGIIPRGRNSQCIVATFTEEVNEDDKQGIEVMSGYLWRKCEGMLTGSILNMTRKCRFSIFSNAIMQYKKCDGSSVHSIRINAFQTAEREKSLDKPNRYYFSVPHTNGRSIFYAGSEGEANEWVSCINQVLSSQTFFDDVSVRGSVPKPRRQLSKTFVLLTEG